MPKNGTSDPPAGHARRVAFSLLSLVGAIEGGLALAALGRDAAAIGYSLARLGLIGMVGLGIAVLLGVTVKGWRDGDWVEGIGRWSGGRRWLGSVLVAGTLAGWAALMLEPYELLPANFQYLAYYQQLQPVLYWGMLLCAQGGFWLLLGRREAMGMAGSGAGKSRRYLFVDAARSTAIALVLFYHAFDALNLEKMLTDIGAATMLSVMRVATPSFITLYGMMVELVYARKADEEGLKSVAPRLLKRSLQCYAGYLVSVAASVWSGYLTLQQGLYAGLFLGEELYSNILKYYTLLLLLTVPLLWLRKKLGLKAALALWVGGWLAVPALYSLAWPEINSPWAYLSGLLVGQPVGQSDFSILHSSILVAIGMLLGARLKAGNRTGNLKAFYRACGLILAIGVMIATFWGFVFGPREYLLLYGTIIRSTHSLAYYGPATAQAMLLIMLFSWMVPAKTEYTRGSAMLLTFGRDSLMAFTLGNVLATVWLRQVETSMGVGFLYIVTLIGAVFLGIQGKNWVRGRRGWLGA